MPCCCKTNIEAASVIGKVFICFAIITILEGVINGSGEHIIEGLSNGVLSGILVFGAVKRNETAILVWIILTSIGISAAIILTLALIIIFVNPPTNWNLSDVYPKLDMGWDRMSVEELLRDGGVQIIAGILIIILIGATVFAIWTVIIANRARNEIKQEQLLPVVQLTGHNDQVMDSKINMGPNVGPNVGFGQPSGLYHGQGPPPSYTTAMNENCLKS